MKKCKGKTINIYSTVHGEVEVISLTNGYDGNNIFCLSDNSNNILVFNEFGQFEEEGECILFPSEKQRDWTKLIKKTE